MNNCTLHSPQFMTIEQKNVATRELNTKLKLEKRLDKALRPLFLRMNKDFKKKYKASGSIVDFSVYRGDIAAVLRKHYDRVQREFKGTIKAPTKQVTDQELIDLGLQEWQEGKLKSQPDFIVQTTQRDADRAINMAIQSLRDDGIAITAATVAATAAVFNRRKLLGRLTGITITETQSAAESTRLIEAQVISGRRPYTVMDDPFALTRPNDKPLKDGTKQWVTVGDANVRATHISANRQTVSIDEPFEVGGYDMRHPADTSLGAPVKEWANCRCASNIQIDF